MHHSNNTDARSGHDLALVILAAGRGSRFVKDGHVLPKPLIQLRGRPFFWWATESVRRRVPLRELVFVVLKEHIQDFKIDQVIREHYPNARLVTVDAVTRGAAESAHIALRTIESPGPVAINDCDHAFITEDLPRTVDALNHGTEAAVVSFRSDSPAYSYAQLNAAGQVCATVEKQVVSPHAIAGCYFFASAQRYAERFAHYQAHCPYNELFLSGIFNLIAEQGQIIELIELAQHCSFGTPEELAAINDQNFALFDRWA